MLLTTQVLQFLLFWYSFCQRNLFLTTGGLRKNTDLFGSSDVNFALINLTAGCAK